MRINLLGRPSIIDDSGVPVSLPAKGYVLLAALLTDFESEALREALVVLLYPNSNGEAGQAAFRQLLKRLRASLPPGCLDFDARRVWAGEALKTSDLAQVLSPEGEPVAVTILNLAAARPLLEDLAFAENELGIWLESRRNRVFAKIRELSIAAAGSLPAETGITALLALRKSLPDDPILGEATIKSLVAQQRFAEAFQIAGHFGELAALGGMDQGVSLGLLGLIPAPPKVVPSFKANNVEELRRPGLAGVPRIVLLRPRKSEFAAVDRRTLNIVDSLIEDLSLQLTSARELAVIAPNTAWQIADGHVRGSSILSGIEYVLETRVRAPEGDPLVSMTLTKAASRESIWADQFRLDARTGSDTYHGARSVLTFILGSIENAELYSFRRTGAPTAYRYYLMGRSHLRTLTLPDVRRARKWFQNASLIDPFFARALSWTAHTLVLEWIMLTGKDPELLRGAEMLAKQALEIDPNDASGYRALARAALFRGILDQSLQWFAQAEHFAPHFADVLADYADTLVHNSMADQAVEKIERALMLNPIPPDTYLWIAAGADFFQGNFEAALSKLRRMANPDQGYRLMAASAAMIGDRVNARAYKDAALSIDPTFEIRTWTQRLPLKDHDHLELYATALKRAGFR